MKETISSMGFANKIRDNILAIQKSSLKPFYEDLKEADCIICSGSGRSLYSLNAAISLFALSKVGGRQKVVLTPDDPGFPGKNMYDAASDLEKRFKKTLLLMNSGSGTSNDRWSWRRTCQCILKKKRLTVLAWGYSHPVWSRL